jgi:hypothetical protein
MLSAPSKSNLETTQYFFSQNMPKHWYLDWPLYLILGISSFLHFSRIQTAEFDFDQADLFRLAHDAIAHGLIPLSGNQASIGVLNPPFFIYTLLPAAALSSNPLGGAITVALFSTIAAGLAYWFTYRYFGRLPAIVAGLLNATAYVPLKYSNTIWQPDILPFFMILFLFAIFRGAVEHRKGWFFPAITFLAITYQLHPSSIVALSTLLIVALIIAPRTVCWHDIFLAVGVLVLLFFPYALLEVIDHFADIKGLVAFAHLPARNDTQALMFYKELISPFNDIQPLCMKIIRKFIQLALLAGLIIASIRLFHPRQQGLVFTEEQKEHPKRWLRSWSQFRFNPERVSCLLLLVWQIIPFANLIHHSIDLHMQYLLLFLPGPFILVSLALDEFVHLLNRFRPNLAQASYIGTLFLSFLLAIGQFVGSTAYIIKMSEGNFNERIIQNLPYIDDMNSMWNAVHQADQVAQKRHISRIYMSMDTFIQSPMSYLGETLHTATTVFGYDNCLVLPASEAGPAVYLIGPYADHIDTMLHQFASTTLVAQPQRLGGRPFKLYIVTPNISGAWLDQNLNSLHGNPETRRWSIQREAPITPRTLYNYQLSIIPAKGARPVTTTCAITALHKNDQLLATFQLPKNEKMSMQPEVDVETYDRIADIHRFGPIQVTTFNTQVTNIQTSK